MDHAELHAAIMRLRIADAALTAIRATEAAQTTERRLAEVALMLLLDESGLTVAGDGTATVKKQFKTVYNIAPGDGWALLHARIRATGEFELLQKRIMQTAVAERMAAGDLLPGVVRVEIPELKLTYDKVRL